MNLVERVKAILLTPKTEWAVIEGESGDAQYLFTNYVAILAAIPAACALLGYSIAGLGAGHALIFAIFSYVIYCIVWYVGALVIDALAPTFGARKSLPDALKVAAYSSTALWVAGIFLLIPKLLLLNILGLYSIYLLWLGLPVLMKAPQDRVTGYTAAAVIAIVVIMFVIAAILGMIIFRD